MKRYLPTILVVSLIGALALAMPVAIRRWSGRMAVAAGGKLDAAREAMAHDDEQGAIDHFRDYLQSVGPTPDPVALEEYAMLLLRRAMVPGVKSVDVASAFDAAEIAVRQRPESIALRRCLGEAKLAKGKPADVLEHLLVVRNAIDGGEATDDADAVDLLLATSWVGTGETDRAAPILARLVGFDLERQTFTDPETISDDSTRAAHPPEAFLLLADLLNTRLRAPAAGNAVLERAHEIHPDDVKVLLAYSRMKATAQDTEAAAVAAARAARIDPMNAAAALADARMKARGADPAIASEAFFDARERFPNHQGIFMASLQQIQRHGTEQEAADILAEGLAKYAHEPQLLAFEAALKIGAGSLGRFTEIRDAARELLGADQQAICLLDARLFLQRHEWYRAEPLLVRSRALVPEASKARIDFMLADCHQKLGDHDLRLAIFQRYAKRGATPGFVLAGLASSQLALGQTEPALETSRALGRRIVAALRTRSDEATEEPDRGERGDGQYQALLKQLPTIVAIERAQPAAKRDWSAVDRLLEALAASPESSDSPIKLARVDALVARGEAARALAELEAALTENDRLVDLQARRLDLLSREMGIEEVRAAFDQLPKGVRNAPTVLLALARAERDAAPGDDHAWLEPLAALVDDLPDATAAVDVYQTLAGMATDAGWLDETRGLWQRAAKRMPDDFRPRLGLALLAARQADPPTANAATAEMVRLEGPDTPRSRVARAAVLLAQARAGEQGRTTSVSAPLRMPPKEAGWLRDARQLLVEAANDRPNWQVIPALGGALALLANDLAPAIDQLKLARACGPESPLVTRDLIDALTRAGRFAEADLLRPTVAPGNLSGGLRSSIDDALRLGDVESALALAHTLIEADDTESSTLIWLARLHGRAGRREDSGRLFQRATEKSPDNPDAWLWLARWHVAGGDPEGAEGVITRGLERVPEGTRPILAARGAVVTGRPDQADEGFLAAVATSGNDIGPAGHAVDYYLQQGKRKQAEAFLENLMVAIGSDLSRTDLETWAARRLEGLRTAAKTADAPR